MDQVVVVVDTEAAFVEVPSKEGEAEGEGVEGAAEERVASLGDMTPTETITTAQWAEY